MLGIHSCKCVWIPKKSCEAERFPTPHFPLLSNPSRISLTGFLTTKTRKGRSLAGVSCGGSFGIRRAVWGAMVHSVLNKHLLAGWNTMQVPMHDKLMRLLGQCWLSTLTNIFFSEGFKADRFLQEAIGSAWLRNSQKHPRFSYCSR